MELIPIWKRFFFLTNYQVVKKPGVKRSTELEYSQKFFDQGASWGTWVAQ